MSTNDSTLRDARDCPAYGTRGIKCAPTWPRHTAGQRENHSEPGGRGLA